MPEACIKMGPVEADIGCADSERRTTLKLLVFTLLIGAYQASAWTYHYGNGNMSWESAREWCKTNYINMVFIRNINENKHLNATLPALNRHYWIGIEKINDTWTWAETQKPVPEDVQNWADNEPSTSKSENCVEMYIYVNKSGRGKWNNDRCTKQKKPLCYQDSCLNSTCNHRGECKEEIGNYTCECWPGFHGNNCEHALSCVDPQNPANGNISCTDKYGKFQYESFCKFSCDEGYELNGRNASLCQHTGEWSEPAPTCLAWNVSYGQQNQIAIVSSVLGTAGLSLSSIPIVYLLRYFRRKKEGDNSHIVKTIKEDPPNTFENPAFEEKDMDSLDL